MSYFESRLRIRGGFMKSGAHASFIGAKNGYVAFRQNTTPAGDDFPEFDFETVDGKLGIKDSAGLLAIPKIGDPSADVIILPSNHSFFDSVRQDIADEISANFDLCAACTGAGTTVDNIKDACTHCQNVYAIVLQLIDIQPVG